MADAPYVSRRAKLTEPNTKSPVFKPVKQKVQTCKLKSCKVTKNLDIGGYCKSHVRKHVNIGELYAECRQCAEEVKAAQCAIACDKCAVFYHIECIGVSKEKYKMIMEDAALDQPALHYYCPFCRVKCMEAVAKIDLLEGQTRNLASNVAKLTERVENLESKVVKTVSQNVRTELDERNDIERRKNNVVVFNMPESNTKDSWYSNDIKQEDTAAIVKIISKSVGVNVSKPNKIKDVLRLGQKNQGKPRPLKVFFTDIDVKRQVLQNSKRLKGSEHHSNIYINPDLTPKQRENDFNLRKELKVRRTEGQQGIYISKGKIVTEKVKIKENPPLEKFTDDIDSDLEDIPDLADPVLSDSDSASESTVKDSTDECLYSDINSDEEDLDDTPDKIDEENSQINFTKGIDLNIDEESGKINDEKIQDNQEIMVQDISLLHTNEINSSEISTQTESLEAPNNVNDDPEGGNTTDVAKEHVTDSTYVPETLVNDTTVIPEPHVDDTEIPEKPVNTPTQEQVSSADQDESVKIKDNLPDNKIKSISKQKAASKSNVVTRSTKDPHKV